MVNKKEKKQEYSVIIFDLDGTLVDSLLYHVRAFEKLLLFNGIKNVSKKKLQISIGIPSKIILKEFKEKYKIPMEIKEMREKRREYFFKLARKKNYLFPGTIGLLKKLKKKYKIAIATSSSREVLDALLSKNHQKMFDKISTIKDVKHGKPEPDQLLFVAKTLKAEKKKCLMIGDSIFDAIAAKRSGMDFIGVRTGYTSGLKMKEQGAKRVIGNLHELNRIL